MKSARKAFLALLAFSLLTGTTATFADTRPSNSATGCTMILDKKTGEWKYCCPSGCIWV